MKKETPLLCHCAALEARGDLEGVEPQLGGHKVCAVFMGNSKEDVECLCE